MKKWCQFLSFLQLRLEKDCYKGVYVVFCNISSFCNTKIKLSISCQAASVNPAVFLIYFFLLNWLLLQIYWYRRSRDRHWFLCSKFFSVELFSIIGSFRFRNTPCNNNNNNCLVRAFVWDEVHPVTFCITTQHFTVNNGVRVRAFITQSSSTQPSPRCSVQPAHSCRISKWKVS